MNPFSKVLDSSIWQSQSNLALNHKKDPYIRLGTVLSSADDTESGDIKYLVEVKDKNDTITIWCRSMTSFGGAYNYEDYVLRGYTPSPLSQLSDAFKAKAGDFVIVACLNGETREGVILGGLKHPSRSLELASGDGPAYTKVFNGIETKITPEGEYTLTFQGLPLTTPLLSLPVAAPILPPQYNPAIAGSYFKFDTTGSIEITDAALALPQSIKMDKTAGSINIKSGTVELNMEKLSQAVTLKSATLDIDSMISITQKTIQYSVEATATIKMKALKIAIGTDGIELFDQLIQAIDALGKVAPISPVGNCAPLIATPQWIAVELIKAKLMVVKGSL